MKKIITAALAALTLAGGMAVGGSALADEHGWRGEGREWHGDRGWHGGWRHGDRDDGAALALGVLAGSALAGGYYAPSYGYYGPAYGYRRHYYADCWNESRWSPYYDRWVWVRVCN